MSPHSHEPDEEEQDRRLGELRRRLKMEHDEEGFLNDKYKSWFSVYKNCFPLATFVRKR